MGHIFSRTFWGLILIILGILFLLREYFGLNIDIGSLIIPFILIYWGVSILIRPRFYGQVGEDKILFTEGHLEANPKNKHYDVIFGKGDIDLRRLQPEKNPQRLEVNVVFAGGTLLLKEGTPVRLETSSAFGSVRTPKGQTAAFGSGYYTSPSYKEGEPHLYIKASAVFGELVVLEK